MSDRRVTYSPYLLYSQKELTRMTMKFGLLIPQGWRMDLVGIADPV